VQASQGDVASLQLLVSLAERSPRAFVETGALESLSQVVSSALRHVQSPSAQQQQGKQGVGIGVLTELVVRAAMAASYVHDDDGTQSGGAGGEYDPPFASVPAAQNLGTSCLAPLLQGIAQCATGGGGDNSNGSIALQHLILAADQVPWLLVAAGGSSSLLESIVQCCLTIAKSTSPADPTSASATVTAFDDGETPVPLLAVQVLSSLMSIGSVRRQAVSSQMRSAMIETCTDVCFSVAIRAYHDNYDDDEWSAEPATLNEDGYDAGGGDSDAALYAEDLLESLIRSFAGQSLAVVLPIVEKLLSPTASPGRNSSVNAAVALAALQRCVKSAPIAFVRHLPAAIEAGLTYSSPSAHSTASLRVQYQSILLLGVVCETTGSKGEEIRQNYAPRILQAFSQTAQSECTKLSALACSAFVSYCRPTPTEVVDAERFVVPYLSDCLSALVAGPLSRDLNDVGSIVAKVRAIGAVACLAEVSGEAFAGFYASVMPGLLSCANAQAPSHVAGSCSYELSRLRGSAVEAATVIGQSIGEDNNQLFVPDAECIMQSAVSILNTPNAESDDVVSGMPLDQLLSACARVSTTMNWSSASINTALGAFLTFLLCSHISMHFPDRCGDEGGIYSLRWSCTSTSA